MRSKLCNYDMMLKYLTLKGLLSSKVSGEDSFQECKHANFRYTEEKRQFLKLVGVWTD